MEKTDKETPIVWYKDWKLIVGIITIIISFGLGIVGKIIPVIKFPNTKYIVAGISVYILSFVILFIGIVLVGTETIKIIRSKLTHNVKQIHQKSAKKIVETSNFLINQVNKKNELVKKVIPIKRKKH